MGWQHGGQIIMRDKRRIKRILGLLERLWSKDDNCDMRLGQLLENYIFTNGERGDRTSIAMWYQEDDDTEEILKGMVKK